MKTLKIIPKLLHFEQKQRRIDIAQDMLTWLSGDPDLLVTGDVSWVYGYNMETKAQTSRFVTIEKSK